MANIIFKVLAVIMILRSVGKIIIKIQYGFSWKLLLIPKDIIVALFWVSFLSFDWGIVFF